MGNDSSSTQWDTQGYPQTETEALFPDRGTGEGTGTNLDDYGIVKYIYANSDSSTNPNMKGEIILEPWADNQSSYAPYWKYTVPASGSRSELKLRVYRYSGSMYAYRGDISNITIHSIGSGWTTNDSFTIPGTAIGGTSPANDVVFGVNTCLLYTSPSPRDY